MENVSWECLLSDKQLLILLIHSMRPNDSLDVNLAIPKSKKICKYVVTIVGLRLVAWSEHSCSLTLFGFLQANCFVQNRQGI